MQVYFTNQLAKFEQAKIMNEVMAEYASRLVHHRITSNMLKSGLEKIKSLEWLPNPEQFAKLCMPTPSDLGIPTLDEARREIEKRQIKYRYKDFDFSHRVVEIVDAQVGFKIRSEKSKVFDKLVEAEYSYWVDRAIKNELPDRKKALVYEPETEVPLDRFVRESGIAIPTGDDPNITRLNEIRLRIKQRKEDAEHG